jgi:hypothetical protein
VNYPKPCKGKAFGRLPLPKLEKLLAKCFAPICQSTEYVTQTDSPDQPDNAHRQQRNEPAFLPAIAQAIAQLKNIETDEVINTTTQNTMTLFFDNHSHD